jgi:hypothetical protein
MSVCPTPPDMDDCKTKKKRCLKGGCVGQAYTEGEECISGSTFDPETCSCEENVCYQLISEVDWVDAISQASGNPCATTYCETTFTRVASAPFTGYGFGNIEVTSFYGSDGTCGYQTRGALVSYRLTTWCDGREDGIDRQFSNSVFGTDRIAGTCRVYLAPLDGSGQRTLVAQADNPTQWRAC